MRFLSELAVKWLPVDEIRRLKETGTAVARLIEPLRFEYQGRRLFVPAGFVTDHASVPRLFWIIFPPVNPRYGRGTVPHDYGYQFMMFPTEDGGFVYFLDRREIDVLFLKAMEADGADWFTRHAIFRAVRIGGWIAWNRYRKEEKNMTETIKRIQALVGVAIDGKAGPATWAAIAERFGVSAPGLGLVAQIRRVQSCLGVAVDGIAGPQTWGAIEQRLSIPDLVPAGIDDRSAKNIATLAPKARDAARRWLLACRSAGLNVKIISGTRTYAEQDALYAKGRTAPGPSVTNAKGGYSNHNFGVAWDFGIFGLKGEYIKDGPDYTRAGEIAEAQGLEWGGRWKSFPDRPHVELKTGMTLAQMRAKVAAGLPVA